MRSTRNWSLRWPGRLGIVAALFGLLSHASGFRFQVWAIVAAIAPYLVLVGIAGTCLLAVTRDWKGLSVGVATLVACLSTQFPLYLADPPRWHGRGLIMMTANLRHGRADPDQVVTDVRNRNVDVLTVQELTQPEIERFRAAGLDELLPFHFVAGISPGSGAAAGTGIWARYPLDGGRSLPGFRYAAVTARLALPIQGPYRSALIQIFAVHPAAPYPNPYAGWRRELGELKKILQAQPRDRIVLVGGDFNSTWDHEPFRALLANGYRDAVQQSGSGSLLSYPSSRWYPPAIAIDHALTRNADVRAVRRLEIRGSDHRALLAYVTLP
jgi:endonuclease/exonuclease/phosphatase (EEP) superfamily protein YafD